MCFYNDGDYDWYAESIEEFADKAEKKTKCMECNAVINIGDDMCCIRMRQYEDDEHECPECNGESISFTEEDGVCDRCNNKGHVGPGETYDYHRCVNCDTFLNVIQEVEQEEGCDAHESRPRLEMMQEQIRDGDRKNAKKYFKHALKSHPELKANGYLGRIANHVFVD